MLEDQPCRGKELLDSFNLPAYLKKHFQMYGGPEYRVTLRCTADLREAMLDRFGRELILFDEPDGCFHFTTPVCVSDPFLGWVCGFGGKVTVTAPAEVRARLANLGRKLREVWAEAAGGILTFFFAKNIQTHGAPGNGRFFCAPLFYRSAGPEGEGGCFDSPSLPPLDSLPSRNDQGGALDPKAECRSGRLAEKALYCASDGLRIAFS